MIRKALRFTYGVKLIATWMIIPFILMFIPQLVSEFRQDITTTAVTLLEETYSGYPDVYRCFKAEVNGKMRDVQAPVTSETGDTITVVLRNGEYYLSVKEPNDYRDHVTFSGRFLRVCNNIFGYHVIGIGAVLLLSFLITIRKRKEIRTKMPGISKVTDIAGLICAVIISVPMVYAVIENSLSGIGFAYLGLFLGIAYTAAFALAWGVASCAEIPCR